MKPISQITKIRQNVGFGPRMIKQGYEILGVKIGVAAPQNVPKTDQNLRHPITFGQKWRTSGQNIFSLKQTGSIRLKLPGNGVSHLILDARTAEKMEP